MFMDMHRKPLPIPAVTSNQNAIVTHTPVMRHNKDTLASRRRLIFLSLNLVTISILTVWMGLFLSSGGWSFIKSIMMLAYMTTLPWLSIGFWNSIIGYILISREQLSSRSYNAEDPWALSHDPAAPIKSRTALAIAVRNEEPESTFSRLRAIHEDLRRQGFAAEFDVHVLSDTSDPHIAAKEQQLVEEWRQNAQTPQQIHYRRRHINTGYKAGNIEEFCRRTVDDYDFFITLDADSLMSGAAIVRAVRMMEANPEVGILQTLVVGIPASTFFTRAFQFGMRHGMRAYTKGSAWWQCDCGPYWGHNAIVRMRPFHDHCTLPKLPGTGPLGGSIMSHDQVEAALMRKAGYHVRVLTDEFGSWEENPPALPDFIQRDLRWCQGNMQYMHILGMPGLVGLSRMQLLLSILMFIASAGWISFVLLGLVWLMTADYITDTPIQLGLWLFGITITMHLAPKLFGLLSVLVSRKESQRNGGRLSVVVSGLCELPFALLLAPIVSCAVTIFMIGLIFGKKISWRVQRRAARYVSWGEAARTFWPQTLLGLGIFLILSLYAAGALVWAVPMVGALVLSIPFAVWTSSQELSNWSIRHKIFSVPEDYETDGQLNRLMKHKRRSHARSDQTVS
ncbi:MAG: glucans biosynthesis glucosyltransferase MdoH [Pseudomonadota bacterium]